MTSGARDQKIVARYLERHAAPEAALVHRLEGPHHAALVVPARDEAPTLLDDLGLGRIVDGRLLIVLVVNGAGPPSRRNLALLEALGAPPGAGFHRRPWGPHELVVLDRCRDRPFGPRQGVGLARKIGLDLALAHHARGALASPWLHTTDADARLPPEHFQTDAADERGALARVAPFWHDTAAGGELEICTALYELWMRHYVAGLAHAGSPYAHDAIGSCISVRAEAYARVRGVPDRAAGEDFHLLDKIAKLGLGAGRGAAIVGGEAGRAPVLLRCRRSQRVPFGTGPGVARIEAERTSGQVPTLHHPAVFAALGHLLAGLSRLAQVPEAGLSAFDGRAHPEVIAELRRSGLLDRLRAAGQAATDPAQRLRRYHEHVDGLRTLQFVHGLEREAFPPLPWPRAVAESPFVPERERPPSSAPGDALAALDGLRRALSATTRADTRVRR